MSGAKGISIDESLIRRRHGGDVAVTGAFQKLVCLASVMGLSGCASVLTGDVQSVRVSVSCKDQEIRTYCTISNNTGRWSVLTPANITVGKSAQPLSISCRGLLGTTKWRMDSSPNIAMAGNIVFGGVVGAVVDHGTARGYGYPALIDLDSPICKYM